jgi:hypothetical protein
MKIRIGDREIEPRELPVGERTYEKRIAMLKAMGDAPMVPGTGLVIHADDLMSIGDPVGSIMADKLDAPIPEDAYIATGDAAYPYSMADAMEAFRWAAAFRERIVAALEAETGDRATAERLAGVVVRALEASE